MLPPHGQVQGLIQLSGRKENRSRRWLIATLSHSPERGSQSLARRMLLSLGSESRSMAMNPQLGGGEENNKKRKHKNKERKKNEEKQKRVKTTHVQSIWLFLIEDQVEKTDAFSLKKPAMFNLGPGIVFYCQTVKGEHSGVKHVSNSLWDLEFSGVLPNSSDSWRQ